MTASLLVQSVTFMLVFHIIIITEMYGTISVLFRTHLKETYRGFQDAFMREEELTVSL